MLIGRKVLSAGSTIRFMVDYEYWLEHGCTLDQNTFSVTVLPDPVTGLVPTDVIVSQVSVTADRLYFFVNATGVNETFTLQVQVKDTRGEVLPDTIEFNVLPD